MEFFGTQTFNFRIDVGWQRLTPSLTMSIWLLKEINILRLNASYYFYNTHRCRKNVEKEILKT